MESCFNESILIVRYCAGLTELCSSAPAHPVRRPAITHTLKPKKIMLLCYRDKNSQSWSDEYSVLLFTKQKKLIMQPETLSLAISGLSC